MLRLCAAVVLLCLAVLPAQARHHGHHHHYIHAIHAARSAVDAPPARYSGPTVTWGHASGATLGGRPAGCPSQWCGCWLGRFLALTDRALWLAANWARVGQPASGPGPGVIAVWRHHVGLVTAALGKGMIMLKSGNDGHAVRERARSAAGVIAWRRV